MDSYSQYDIVKKLPDDGPLWAGTTASMEAAEKRITELATTGAPEYAICDSRNGLLVKTFNRSPRSGCGISEHGLRSGTEGRVKHCSDFVMYLFVRTR